MTSQYSTKVHTHTNSDGTTELRVTQPNEIPEWTYMVRLSVSYGGSEFFGPFLTEDAAFRWAETCQTKWIMAKVQAFKNFPEQEQS